MTTFSWILLAVGAYLVLHAAIVMFRAGRGGGDTSRETLGCGFILIAALVWSIALARWLDDASAGARLGIALALLLPVLATLLGGNRRRLVASIVLLTLAILIGASSVPVLWDKLHPPRTRVTLEKVDAALGRLDTQIANTQAYLGRLAEDRERLKEEIRTLGYADFSALAADPRGYALLQELDEIDRLERAARGRLTHHAALLGRLKTARRRLRRRLDAEASGIEVEDAELDAILAEARREPTTSLAPATVEEHVERQRLQDLFQREF
ncbi:MAG: hypothetical protein ACODAJ_05500 [Planctomycetota bacterium]